MRFALPLFLLLVLVGCDTFGDSVNDTVFDNLAPGTFRMVADDEDRAGTARYYRDRFLTPGDSTTRLEPLLSFETERGDRLSMKDDELLNTESGDRLDIDASYVTVDGGVFGRRSGVVEITYSDSTRIEGTFRFRMKDYAMGCLACRTITVEGGFNATVQ
jgi:hypothetical protein